MFVPGANLTYVPVSYVSETDLVDRRTQLRNLDAILTDLESLNLRGIERIPRPLYQRLRRAGIGQRDGAPVSELIDLVFRAQEPLLQHLPSTVTRRPRAA